MLVSCASLSHSLLKLVAVSELRSTQRVQLTKEKKVLVHQVSLNLTSPKLVRVWCGKEKRKRNGFLERNMEEIVEEEKERRVQKRKESTRALGGAE